jgi:hypothetical protein
MPGFKVETPCGRTTSTACPETRVAESAQRTAHPVTQMDGAPAERVDTAPRRCHRDTRTSVGGNRSAMGLDYAPLVRYHRRGKSMAEYGDQFGRWQPRSSSPSGKLISPALAISWSAPTAI